MGICKLHRGTGYSHLSRVKTLYPAAAPAQYSPIHNVSFRQKNSSEGSSDNSSKSSSKISSKISSKKFVKKSVKKLVKKFICKLHHGTGYSHLSRVKTLYFAAAPDQYSPIRNVSFTKDFSKE